MEWKDRIVTDPGVCGGRPRLKGTRLTVEFLLGLKAAGWSEKQILDNYPHITLEDLQAVFAYAQTIIQDEIFLSAPAA
ncbi:MAG: DUF433 domain-containing protein [candidate division NC10 bacterium]|nr:DUF433 domain-containing protein [candidate division NC10 bacterium]